MDSDVCSSYLALKHDVRTKGVRTVLLKVTDPETRSALLSKKRCKTVLNTKWNSVTNAKNFPATT